MRRPASRALTICEAAQISTSASQMVAMPCSGTASTGIVIAPALKSIGAIWFESSARSGARVLGLWRQCGRGCRGDGDSRTQSSSARGRGGCRRRRRARRGSQFGSRPGRMILTASSSPRPLRPRRAGADRWRDAAHHRGSARRCQAGDLRRRRYSCSGDVPALDVRLTSLTSADTMRCGKCIVMTLECASQPALCVAFVVGNLRVCARFAIRSAQCS